MSQTQTQKPIIIAHWKGSSVANSIDRALVAETIRAFRKNGGYVHRGYRRIECQAGSSVLVFTYL